jgi:hypothetical protein
VIEYCSSVIVSYCCKKLVVEARDSSGTQSKGKSAVGSRYQATTVQDTADREELMRVVINC